MSGITRKMKRNYSKEEQRLIDQSLNQNVNIPIIGQGQRKVSDDDIKKLEHESYNEEVNKSLDSELGKVYEHFKNWCIDESLIDQFRGEGLQILPSKEKDTSLILVEAYIYIPERKETDLIPDNLHSNLGFAQWKTLSVNQEKNVKTFPFVKILAVQNNDNNSNVKVGEIYAVKDGLAVISQNPDYIRYWEQLASQPSLKDHVKVPPKFIMGWDNWEMFRYRINKFDMLPSIQEEMTFLIPDKFLIAIHKHFV